MRIKIFKLLQGLFFGFVVCLSVVQARDYNDALIFVGAAEFKTELAITPAEQRKGLMFRQSLKEDEAMLFIYPAPRSVAFWMRNTLIPLDMLFLMRMPIWLKLRRISNPVKVKVAQPIRRKAKI